MRVAIITESFPPDVNGVAHCVLQVAENLISRGHQPLVIAPRPSRSTHARPAAKDPAPAGWPPGAPRGCSGGPVPALAALAIPEWLSAYDEIEERELVPVGKNPSA
jgi:phosphatidylinositol alpha 1,6-mannosyltransferase